MKDSPPVLSIGRRCMQDGWSFVWEAEEAPYVILPSGKIITCIVEGNVPCLPHRPLPVAAVPRTTNQRAAPGCVRAPLPALAGGGDAPANAKSVSGVATPGLEVEEAAEAEEQEEVAAEAPSGTAVDPTSLEHLLTHLPKHPHCSACQRAKLVKKHARR